MFMSFSVLCVLKLNICANKSAVSLIFVFGRTAKRGGKERRTIQENKMEWTNRAEGTRAAKIRTLIFSS